MYGKFVNGKHLQHIIIVFEGQLQDLQERIDESEDKETQNKYINAYNEVSVLLAYLKRK